MAGYIVRRLLQSIPVLLGTTFLIYFMVFAMPGDPIIALFGEKTPPPAVVEQLRERYHLDQPFIVQYLILPRRHLPRRPRHVLLRRRRSPRSSPRRSP